MLKINTKKWLKYKEIQENPTLALFRFLEQAEQKLGELAIQYQKDLANRLKEEIEGIKTRLESEIRAKVKENIFQDILQIKGEKGDKGEIGLQGDKGDSIKGEKGLQGFPGIQGIKGEKGLDGKSGKDGKDGKDAKSPKKYIDYFTKDEINDIVSKIVGLIKLKPIEEKLKELIKKIDQMEKAQVLGARRTLHRGGASYTTDELLGTGDGTTTQFTLTDTPYDDTALPFLFVGGGVHFKTDDWIRSGKVITFLTAPPLNAKVRAPIYRKS